MESEPAASLAIYTGKHVSVRRKRTIRTVSTSTKSDLRKMLSEHLMQHKEIPPAKTETVGSVGSVDDASSRRKSVVRKSSASVSEPRSVVSLQKGGVSPTQHSDDDIYLERSSSIPTSRSETTSRQVSAAYSTTDERKRSKRMDSRHRDRELSLKHDAEVLGQRFKEVLDNRKITRASVPGTPSEKAIHMKKEAKRPKKRSKASGVSTEEMSPSESASEIGVQSSQSRSKKTTSMTRELRVKEVAEKLKSTKPKKKVSSKTDEKSPEAADSQESSMSDYEETPKARRRQLGSRASKEAAYSAENLPSYMSLKSEDDMDEIEESIGYDRSGSEKMVSGRGYKAERKKKAKRVAVSIPVTPTADKKKDKKVTKKTVTSDSSVEDDKEYRDFESERGEEKIIVKKKSYAPRQKLLQKKGIDAERYEYVDKKRGYETHQESLKTEEDSEGDEEEEETVDKKRSYETRRKLLKKEQDSDVEDEEEEEEETGDKKRGDGTRQKLLKKKDSDVEEDVEIVAKKKGHGTRRKLKKKEDFDVEEDEVEIVGKKKGYGTRRKLKRKEDFEAEPESDEEEEEIIIARKKGYGPRRKLLKKKEDSEVEGDEEEDETVARKKGYGPRQKLLKKKEDSEVDSEEEEDETVARKKGYGPRRKLLKKKEDSEVEGDEEEDETVAKKKGFGPRRKLLKKKEDSEVEGDEEEDETVAKKKGYGPRRKLLKKKEDSEVEGDEEEDETVARKKDYGPRRKLKKKEYSEVEGDEEEDETVARKKGYGPRRKLLKKKEDSEVDSEEEEDETVARKKDYGPRRKLLKKKEDSEVEGDEEEEETVDKKKDYGPRRKLKRKETEFEDYDLDQKGSDIYEGKKKKVRKIRATSASVSAKQSIEVIKSPAPDKRGEYGYDKHRTANEFELERELADVDVEDGQIKKKRKKKVKTQQGLKIDDGLEPYEIEEENTFTDSVISEQDDRKQVRVYKKVKKTPKISDKQDKKLSDKEGESAVDEDEDEDEEDYITEDYTTGEVQSPIQASRKGSNVFDYSDRFGGKKKIKSNKKQFMKGSSKEDETRIRSSASDIFAIKSKESGRVSRRSSSVVMSKPSITSSPRSAVFDVENSYDGEYDENRQDAKIRGRRKTRYVLQSDDDDTEYLDPDMARKKKARTADTTDEVDQKRKWKRRAKKVMSSEDDDEDEENVKPLRDTSISLSIATSSTETLEKDEAVKKVGKRMKTAAADRRRKTGKGGISDVETSESKISVSALDMSMTDLQELSMTYSQSEQAAAEQSPVISPVECEWVLVGPRILVCRHPVLGEIRAQPTSFSTSQNFIGWPDRSNYNWQAFYDSEIYTVRDPFFDDAKYGRRPKK